MIISLNCISNMFQLVVAHQLNFFCSVIVDGINFGTISAHAIYGISAHFFMFFFFYIGNFSRQNLDILYWSRSSFGDNEPFHQAHSSLLTKWQCICSPSLKLTKPFTFSFFGFGRRPLNFCCICFNVFYCHAPVFFYYRTQKKQLSNEDN